jgi:tetratricopeptide (TPR) repeat protein
MPVSRKRAQTRKGLKVGAPAVIPDRAAMEAFLTKLGPERAEEATERAQDLMYDAWDLDSPARALTLAYKALGISPLCADAYSFIADRTANEALAIDLCRRGVEAGRLALDPSLFEDCAGQFWGVFETRPYMRALHFLGLEAAGQGLHVEAADAYREMLRLNPNDNQGARYLLLDALLALGRDDEAAALLKTYREDGSAHWLYSRALMRYREKGDVAPARTALAKAFAQNPHVPPFLTGRKPLPRTPPLFVGWGDKDEAVAYAQDSAAPWTVTPGALAWLKDIWADYDTPKLAKPSRRAAPATDRKSP